MYTAAQVDEFERRAYERGHRNGQRQERTAWFGDIERLFGCGRLTRFDERKYTPNDLEVKLAELQQRAMSRAEQDPR